MQDFNKKRILCNTPQNYGFSLVEVIVSLGILSVISLGLAFNTANLFKNQTMLSDRGEAKNFSNNLADYLGSIEFCEGELVGRPLPARGRRALTVSGMGAISNMSRNVQNGSLLSENVRVNNITIENKLGVPTQQIFDGTNNLDLRVARVTLNLQNKDLGSMNDEWIDLRPKHVDIPVLVLAGQITACGMSAALDPQITCAAVGNTWNSSEGTCDPEETCNLRGTFTTWTCTPTYGTCGQNITASIGGTAGAVGGGKGASSIGGIPNPVTGDLSCPPGASPEISGERTANYNISCGKKCSRNITETTVFYICMECG